MSSIQKNLELGREKLGQGDYLGALAHADAVLAQEAGSFDALQLRSRALYLLGRDAEALQTLRQAHAVFHQHLLADPTPELLADEAEALEEVPPAEEAPIGTDALETLLALRERYRLDSELLALLAELAEDNGRYEIAREAFEELVEVEPDHLEAWVGLVHVLSHDDLDAAMVAVTRALQRYPDHALFHEFLGFINFRRRRYRQAIAAYRQAIARGADHPDNYEMLVQCYLGLGEMDTALSLTRELASHDSHDAETQRFVIHVALQCRQPDLALEHTHQLMRLQPSHAETYCYKALVELTLGDWPAAERTLRLGFHKAMDGPYALFELVDMLIETDELDDALRVADLAYELNPDHPESSAARGKVLREVGAFEDALAAFRQAATLAPQDDVYQTWMGIIYDYLGDGQAAIRQFNHVLSRHPSDVWTLFSRGMSYLTLEMAERALADFSRGIDIDNEDAQLYFWRACALIKLGDKPAALRDLRRAVDLSDEIYGWLEQEPALDPLRHDPRFRQLLIRPDLGSDLDE